MTAPPLFWSWLASSLLRKCSTEGQQLLLLLISAVKRIVCWGTGLEKYLALVNRKPSKKKKSYPALTGLLVKRRGGNAAEKYTCWTRVKHVISVYSPSTNSFFFFKYISICFSQTFSQNLCCSFVFFFFPCSTYAGYTEEAIVFFFYNNPLLNLITFNCYYLDAEGCSVSLLPSIVIQ